MKKEQLFSLKLLLYLSPCSVLLLKDYGFNENLY